MDNIMDKLAQKLSAQEMIKANSQAEVESAISDATEIFTKKMDEATDSFTKKVEDALSKKMEESDSKTHDVGVQTYRNVQALINKQQEKTAEEFKELDTKLETLQYAVESKNSGLLPLIIITLLVAGADLVINILRIFGIL
ncbi:MAG: hypothetical protein E7304_10975 [Butyrivibrio sp.]|uniref:hypothetical protein n=1 Tax=unclassified Butyrivibrio TaxID=2639466 RepID=UPI00115F9791|nr:MULTISPECIES: hypothetical protein [unclassified Butyrivibrio]MBE5841911.1 hypothetical protein [Butyrivibrio sp.]